MKKCIICIILFGLLVLNLSSLAADEYTNYQEIIFENQDVLLLKEFSDKDYENFYKKTFKRRMFGWRIYAVNKNESVDFIAETKIKIFNSGSTPIKYNINLETKEETKQQITATGSIQIKGSGAHKKFKGSVDASIKASISTSKTTTNKETFEFSIQVDPLTYVSILTRGSGEINNGVGVKYFLWAKSKKGGWETFTVQTEYYEIIKARF